MVSAKKLLILASNCWVGQSFHDYHTSHLKQTPTPPESDSSGATETNSRKFIDIISHNPDTIEQVNFKKELRQQHSRRSWLQHNAMLVASTAATALSPHPVFGLSTGVVLVTGANSGIGKATAKQLAGRGYSVILGCREVIKAQTTAIDIKTVYPDATVMYPKIPLDLADLISVAAFAAEIKALVPMLSGLVLCAGIDGAPETRTAQGNELHMSVNHLGHMLLTAELTKLLRKQTKEPARVISITSSAAIDVSPPYFDDIAWARNKYNKRQAYCLSKACNILFSDYLALREKGNIFTAAIDPGPTVTQIVKYALPQRAQQREGMSTEQLERQAKQLGYRTPDQAGTVVTSSITSQSSTEQGELMTSGGLYLGIASPPGLLGPLITEPILWRTPAQAAKVWAASADLMRPFATSDAILN